MIPDWIGLVALYSLLAFVAYFFLGSFAFGAGFQPSPRREIDVGARLAGVGKDTVVYDAGSGIGTVALYIAKEYSARCVGIEVDPLRIAISRFRLRMNPALKDRVEFRRGNLLDADFSKADVVYSFLSGGSGIMDSLRQKIMTEAKPGTRVISYCHPFKGWTPSSSSGEIRVYTLSSKDSRIAD
jgi:ribosomal protein L11 methylase PrmA